MLALILMVLFFTTTCFFGYRNYKKGERIDRQLHELNRLMKLLEDAKNQGYKI